MITPIDGKPTYTIIHSLHNLLKSNTASVSGNLGCSTLGYLCLTLYPNIYKTLLVTPVIPTPNTRALPGIPVGTTGPEAASL